MVHCVCIYTPCLKNVTTTGMSCYSFDRHEPILIYFGRTSAKNYQNWFMWCMWSLENNAFLIAYFLRPSQPQIQHTHQYRQDQGNGERRHSVSHTHSE